jgi:hypothetical protein
LRTVRPRFFLPIPIVLRNPSTDPEWGGYGWEPATAGFYQEKAGKYFNTLIDYLL